MATLSEPSGLVRPIDEVLINKPPPITTSGPLAWVRANLFKSTFDSLLTIVAGAITIALIMSSLTWIIGGANWFIITRNLRTLMVGNFPVEAMWRVEVAALLCAFIIGVTVFAYMRSRFSGLITLIGIGAALLLLPMVVRMVVPPTATLLTAGETPIVSGTISETPLAALSFIARAGETVTIRIAGDASISDDALAAANGFRDRAASALSVSAANRLADIAHLQTLDARLASDTLTANQRARAEAERAALVIEAPISETTGVITASARVAIVDGASGDIISEAVITRDDAAPFSVTLPRDGWYIVQKTIADGGSTALLETTGIYPLIEQNFTRVNAAGVTARVDEFTRITDDFSTREPRPEVDGREVPTIFLTDSQYGGARTLGDFLALYLAPFAASTARLFIPLAIAGVVGWGFGLALMRLSSSRRDPKAGARTASSVLWAIFMLILFSLIYGVGGLDAVGLAALLGRFAWVGAMYYAGRSQKRAWGAAALAVVLILGMAQLIAAERITIERAIRLEVPWAWAGVLIWLVVGVWAARRGAAAAVIGERVGVRGLIGSLMVWAGLVTFPLIAVNGLISGGALTPAAAGDLLQITDTRRWGGFLLTLLLTAVAILASFPLGVLLALGRRSTLPVVKWTCIAYIELVRGVPLITVLFMAQLLVPLVNPALAEVDNVFRAMVGLTLFSAAYLAENVRGGLQAISSGQEEAARALGLNGAQVTLLITLPQALRLVIPALVGQCIALYKDTSLVALVGLADLTGAARSILAQPEYLGLQSEVYLFISVLYFIVSYIMASISRRIEASGSGAVRRL